MSASEKPPFPEAGSLIGQDDQFFCLGRLGRGTFCSIHKCIDLSYAHTNNNTTDSKDTKNFSKRKRVVAAKVELSDFTNSGVLDGEATVLKHLSTHMHRDMIPTFVDYVKTSTTSIPPSSSSPSPYHNFDEERPPQEISAIIMEYLPGEDMHKLRDRHCQSINQHLPFDPSHIVPECESKTRRLSIQDSVYLCADVLLPLLRSMHNCGVIHRDVKPSNVVRTGTGADEREFKLVDFGLSKTFVVPLDNDMADKRYPWDRHWMKSPSKRNDVTSGSADSSTTSTTSEPKGCIRKERSSAEFRGTSMYASLRVHQLRDYSRRDDLWGLIYVFCDLVAGGLPWMVPASERNRDLCQRIKEWVQGERHEVDQDGAAAVGDNAGGDSGSNDSRVVCEDRFAELLKGANYHNAKYKKGSYGPVTDESDLPDPLSLSKDEEKVDALRKALRHLSTLSFFDEPDYDLIQECLHSFLKDSKNSDETSNKHALSNLNWEQPSAEETDKKRWDRKIGRRKQRKTISTIFRPSLQFQDEADYDPLQLATLEEAEREIELVAASEGSSGESTRMKHSQDIEDLLRLPLTLQYRLAQVEYNAKRHESIPIHLAFRDWMELATSLVYDHWDSYTYERGNHRRDDDGYRQELYMKLIQKCLDFSKPFKKFLRAQEFYNHPQENEKDSVRACKRRKLGVHITGGTSDMKQKATNNSSRLLLSKVLLCLKYTLEVEETKPVAPPPALKF